MGKATRTEPTAVLSPRAKTSTARQNAGNGPAARAIQSQGDIDDVRVSVSTSIARMDVYVVDPSWRKKLVFVRLETRDGAVGWGEAYTQYDRDSAITALLGELGRYLAGRSVFGVKNFLQIAFDDFAQRRGSLELFSALSAIEQAMWDVIGRMLGQPVYNLLGGPVRDKLRLYANGWGYGLTRPTDYANAAEKLVARGFDALKLDPLPKPWRTFIGTDHLRAGEEVLATVRRAVGPGVDLLIDNHRRLAPMHAVELAKRYEKYGIYWFEEPCQAHNLEAMRYIRERIATPVVTGEELYGKSAFRPVFERGAADIVNPDVCSVGGILELRDIAAMAEPYLVGVSPHNYNSTSVSLAATVQASVVMPNFIIGEYFVPFEDVSKRISPDALRPINGIVDLPGGPGLGVTVDEAFLRGQRHRPSPPRQFATLHSRVL